MPAPFLGRRQSVTNQRAQPWRRKPEAVSGGWSGPRGGGLRAAERRRAAVLGCEGGGRCYGGGCGAVKTAGMVGRENELSIHFVPGDCRLVEVKESSWGSRGNWGCRVGRTRSRRPQLFSMHLLPGAPDAEFTGATFPALGDLGGAIEFVYLNAHRLVFSLSASAAGNG